MSDGRGLVKKTPTILGAMGGAFVAATIIFSLLFYQLGSLRPDQTTGRVFPIQMHGTLYVSGTLATLYYLGFGIGGLLIVSGLLVHLMRPRTE
jgi:hypothetical protein